MYPSYTIQRPIFLSKMHTAFSKRFEPDYVFRGESHDFYEIVLVLEGCIGVTAGATSFTLEAPAAVLHPPMEFHSIRSAQGTAPQVTVFSFTAEAMPDFPRQIFSLNEEQIAIAQQALRLMQVSFIQNGLAIQGATGEKAREAQRAVLALESFLLTLSATDDPFAQKETSASGRNYRRALRIIEENLTQPLNTAELARLTHMSPSLLKKIFARHAGVGVMEYFRTRKIHAAIPLLREGLGIQEIAGRLGFSNAGYFSTVFRRVTGHVPSYYRNH